MKHEDNTNLVFKFLNSHKGTGYTYQEIAEKTGLLLKTVKNIISMFKKHDYILRVEHNGNIYFSWREDIGNGQKEIPRGESRTRNDSERKQPRENLEIPKRT